MLDENKMNVVDCMLSTSDNPFNPFDEFDKWYKFDVTHGYDTCGYLARVCEHTEGLEDREERLSINDAIEDAIRFNLTGNRIIVTRDAMTNA